MESNTNVYLATRTGVPVSNVADVIQFNLNHFEAEREKHRSRQFERFLKPQLQRPRYL